MAGVRCIRTCEDILIYDILNPYFNGEVHTRWRSVSMAKHVRRLVAGGCCLGSGNVRHPGRARAGGWVVRRGGNGPNHRGRAGSGKSTRGVQAIVAGRNGDLGARARNAPEHTVVTVTETLLPPFVPEGYDVAAGAGAKTSATHPCVDHAIRVDRYKGGVHIFSFESRTNFCYDGRQLAHRDPRFTWRKISGANWWDITSQSSNESGGVGDWEHWDWVNAEFERCVQVIGCTGESSTVDIEKWQRGDGTVSDRVR